MSSRQFIQIGKRTKKYDELNTQTTIKKYRIIPQWQTDKKLSKTQPKQSRQTTFIVKRKQQIQKNRWSNIIKQLNKFQDVRDSRLEQFKRKMSVRIGIGKDNQGKLLKYINLSNCKNNSIDSSFRKGEVFQRLVRRTQPYWKNYFRAK